MYLSNIHPEICRIGTRSSSCHAFGCLYNNISFLLTPYRRKSYFYRMFMISLIGNDKIKLKLPPVCRYLCIVPKHTDNIGQFQNVTVFKYQLINISA